VAADAPAAAAAAPDLLALPAHIAEEDQVERLFATVLDRFGRLDIPINNVGMNLLTPSSIAGRQAAPGMGIYGVAKAGLEMLTRVLAVELAPDNIQVNAVAPSMVKTDFSAPVLFLASDAAGYTTGQTLIVDGGSTS
jgi:NAD(P)-dependent dehydrogenase (short-subunit alcohol dehydrogenase family)